MDNNRISDQLVQLSIPTPQMQVHLAGLGFVFFSGTYRVEDYHPDRINVLLPQGWRIEVGVVANLIFDEDQQSRFLDFMPSMEYKFGLIAIEISPTILARMEKSKDGSIVTSGIPLRDILRLPHCAMMLHDDPLVVAALLADMSTQAIFVI